MDPALLAAVAGVLLAFAAISGKAERGVLTAPMAFVAAGFLLSDQGVGVLSFEIEGGVVHGLAELTLVLVLFTDASRIDLACVRREGGIPLRLLAFGMPLTLVAGALAAVALLPGLRPVDALLLSAILTPTDAALGQAVVTSSRIPVRIRQALNVESGLNDGIALPLVLVLASLAGATEAEGGPAFWLRFAALQLTLGPLVGAAVGGLGGRLLERGALAGWVSPPFQRLSGLGLALLAFAGAEVVGGNGFIAAFVAGLALGNVARGICPRIHDFGEAEGQLLALLVFLVFGGLVVPAALPHVDAEVVLYAVASLTVVRMLPVALALMGSGLLPSTVAFLGWFGPRGLASILFAMIVVEEGRLADGARVEAIVTLTVLLSTLLHGMSAQPLAGMYARRIAARRARAHVEHAPVVEHPVRHRAHQGRDSL